MVEYAWRPYKCAQCGGFGHSVDKCGARVRRGAPFHYFWLLLVMVGLAPAKGPSCGVVSPILEGIIIVTIEDSSVVGA